MSLYDTRFFFEHYYSGDQAVLRKTKAILGSRGEKYVSVITVHELYKLSLEKEGRDVAKLRASLIEKEFEVLPVNAELSILSAELRSKYRIPMADSMIAASAKILGVRCITDDPHLSKVREIRTQWI